MRRLAARSAVTVLVVLAASSAPGQPPDAAPSGGILVDRVLVDRVVARIDDQPILHSDVERAVRLGLVAPESDESADEVGRRALERLVDQRLRLREAERFGTAAIDPEAVDRQVEAVAERFGGHEALLARLAELGLDLDGLRYLLERQLAVLAYIDSYLAPRVFVPTDEVMAYYRDELVPEMARRGEEAPPIEEVREAIRRVLRERRLDREIADWTAELRAAADIEIVPPLAAPLPPVRERLGPPGGGRD